MRKYFDTYNIRARICVSVFYAAPFILDIFFMENNLFSITESVLISIILISVSQALLNTHRPSSKESKIPNFAAELLSPLSELNPVTRFRYYEKLASLEKGFDKLIDYVQSDDQSQEEIPSEISDVCADVVTWLRAKTRNPEMFRMVYEENINYGYIRNMLKIKTQGVATNFIAIIFFGAKIVKDINFFNWSEHGTLCICIVFHLAVILYLMKFINKYAVEISAKRYAFALLETINIL